MLYTKDSVSKTSVLLNDPTKGQLLRPGIWSRTHSYSEECVALILASVEYSRGMYVYDYEEYMFAIDNKTGFYFS